MLPNEVFAQACRAYYDEIGLDVDATNGEFAHSPLTKKECDTGYYLLHGHHQHQGLLQSKDLNKCCFFASDALTWLKGCDYWPENYFELWDIYDRYSGDNVRKLHKEKDENGKSLYALELNKEKDENGKSLIAVKGAEKLHEAKDENGKSLQGIENGKRMHEAKDENGKSLVSLKAHEAKDENGKSLLGLANAKRLHAQVWESTIDKFRSTAGAVANHNKANGWDPDARIRVG
jgi:hypothetical protein